MKILLLVQFPYDKKLKETIYCIHDVGEETVFVSNETDLSKVGSFKSVFDVKMFFENNMRAKIIEEVDIY